MSAKDYQICPAMFNAYIAKVSKRNPNLMTDDRREITDAEIMNLSGDSDASVKRTKRQRCA